MNDDLIKRSDVINLCGKWRNRTNEHHDKNGWYIADTLLKAIKELPSADRPQGEWIVSDKDSVCSVCGKDEAEFICGTEDWYGYGLSNYCPNCGARMKGAEDD